MAEQAYVEPGQDQTVHHDVDKVHDHVDQKTEFQRARLGLEGSGKAQS